MRPIEDILADMQALMPWLTWAYGDFGVKIGMAVFLLAPFRVLMPIVAPALYQPARPAAGR